MGVNLTGKDSCYRGAHGLLPLLVLSDRAEQGFLAVDGGGLGLFDILCCKGICLLYG